MQKTNDPPSDIYLFGRLVQFVTAIAMLSAALAVVLVAMPNAVVATAVDAYVRPYVQTNNFSGGVIVEQHGRPIFEKAYGLADREAGIPNTLETRFHIASMSMQFTAAGVLRLVAQGRIQLDGKIGEIVPDLDSAAGVTVRELLEERSGLVDINGLSNYDEILSRHQTPAGLVAQFDFKPPVSPPGSKYIREDHSAYNVLALVIEKVTGQPFAYALRALVFDPFGMRSAGADDDAVSAGANMAKGYEPEGESALTSAQAIHWSAKSGNGSTFETAKDQAKWTDALFNGEALRGPERDAMLDATAPVGYGWFKTVSSRFGETAYYMNGRAAGFSSFVLHLAREDLTVVLLSNVYSSATTTMGNDIAAIVCGRTYEAFHPIELRLTSAETENSSGTFRFGSDFFAPNAKVILKIGAAGASLLWPSGDASPLIPVGTDQFMDRKYWESVRIVRGVDGAASALDYGTFRGDAVKTAQHKRVTCLSDDNAVTSYPRLLSRICR